MLDISKKFNEIEGFDAFLRVDDNHIIDIYIGIDLESRKTLFIISPVEPPIITSSHIVSVLIGKRRDNSWGLSFVLLNNDYSELFYSFCNDLIESSRNVKNRVLGTQCICDRYEQWQEMLTKRELGVLTFPVIKGLIGELIFLRDYLFKKYGINQSINSWVGPDGVKQDFMIGQTWFEVKSLVSGADTVDISSLEQLDSSNLGELVLIFLDEVSISSNEKLTLNNLYSQILAMIVDVDVKKIFIKKINQLGYTPRYEYDEYAFCKISIQRYLVDNEFPCLRRSQIARSVVEAKYKISLAAIQNKLLENIE